MVPWRRWRRTICADSYGLRRCATVGSRLVSAQVCVGLQRWGKLFLIHRLQGQKVTASRVSSLGSQQYENLRRQYVRLLNSKMQVAQGAVLTEDSSKVKTAGGVSMLTARRLQE